MLILDFDGTLTDAEEEGVPFTEGFLRDLATLTGAPQEQVTELYACFQAMVLADPTKYAWYMSGLAVAPATVDPYLRIKPIAGMILDELGIVMDSKVRENLITHILFRDNYRLTKTCFRPGARRLLEDLYHDRDWIDAVIVTNSAPDAVLEKIAWLSRQLNDLGATGYPDNFLAFWRERLHGGAKKYVVNNNGDSGSAKLEFQLAGLDRPVYCKRPYYFDVLHDLVLPRGLVWADVLVVGDIFELDLALPLALGCNVALMKSDKTPPYEIDFLGTRVNARVLDSVSQILPHYRETRVVV